MRIENTNIKTYLLETDLMNYSHQKLQELLATEFRYYKEPDEFIRAVCNYVRNEISHSWDMQSRRITIKASDVLKYKEGICYSKTILLAALLRSGGIPAGFCYQKLIKTGAHERKYDVHALNAVYFVSENRWRIIETHGGKAGITDEVSFNVKMHKPARIEMGEIDYPIIYSNPHPKTISVLRENTDCLEMCINKLPSDL